MTYSATAINVMIASPWDVDAERGIIRKVIYDWNDVNSVDKQLVLMPVSWETHSAPSMKARAQEVINHQILDDADLLIGVFWTRLGTPTGEAPSGTVEEIEKHIAAGKPTMIYFSSNPVQLESVDNAQWAALQEFKESLMARGLISTYDKLEDFKGIFAKQLGIKIIEEFSNTSTSETNNILEALEYISPAPQLSEEATTLLTEATKDSNGIIMRIRYISGMDIGTNGIHYIEKNNPRSQALWESAVDQLVQKGLIKDRGFKGELYQVTAEGYEFVDNLS